MTTILIMRKNAMIINIITIIVRMIVKTIIITIDIMMMMIAMITIILIHTMTTMDAKMISTVLKKRIAMNHLNRMIANL